MERRGLTFVLVHGAWHGAWCWQRVVPELEARGASAIAVDLPCDDVDAGPTRYAAVVVDACRGLDEPVLVGHSLAGITIPLVAAARPVRSLVYLCALIAQPGISVGDQTAAEPDMFCPGFAKDAKRDELDRSYWPDADAAAAGMYPECSRADSDWAFARLRRQARVTGVEQCPLAALPDVRSTYVLGRRDGAISPDWSRRAARERLGLEPLELDSGHSPFLTQPAELAELLLSVA